MTDVFQIAQSRLPSAVLDLALRLGVDPAGGARDIHLTQKGRMKSNLASSKWMAFTAKQWLAADRCAFGW